MHFFINIRLAEIDQYKEARMVIFRCCAKNCHVACVWVPQEHNNNHRNCLKIASFLLVLHKKRACLQLN